MTATLDRTPTSARGRTVIERTVIEKIAGQAAVEVGPAGGRSGGLFGIGARDDLHARPAVTVDLVGGAASIAVDAVVAYPEPLAAAAERVRSRVVDLVGRYAGVQVTRVDVTVVGLVRAEDTPRTPS